MAALALTLTVPASVEAGGGGIGGGMSLGGGSFGHAGLGAGTGGNLGHAGLGNTGSLNLGHMSSGIGGGRGSIGFGGSQLSTGVGLTRGIGTPGGDDLHLGLSSHDLGLGNNFGLNLPGNVLNRAARVSTSPLEPGIGLGTGGRSNLKDFDGTTGDGRHSSQAAKGSQAGSGGSKTNDARKVGEDAGRLEATDLEGQLLLQQRLAAERQAELPPIPTPANPPASTTPVIAPTAPTLLQTFGTVATTGLGSGEVQMIGTYFAQNGAPVASIPTSSVNVSVGGTVPESVALFPPPYDLASQVSDVDFSYFVWGNNVVVVDGQTDVVAAIIPDVLAHQD